MVASRSLVVVLMVSLCLGVCISDDSASGSESDNAAQVQKLKESVFFKLYTRSAARSLGQDLGEHSRVKNLLNKTLYILVHGLDGYFDDDFNRNLRPALLNATDCHVISVDWSSGASNVSYEEAIENMPASADGITHRLQRLLDAGVALSRVRFIGFSLGAQMGGYVSRRLNGTRLSHIMALDPAGLYFEGEENSIRKDDADYLEVIHTCTGLALIQPVGHNDFYPNKGQLMPGCTEPGTTFMQQEFCSHSRAYQYYTETINNRHFMARQCSDYEEMFNNTFACANTSQIHMGGLLLDRKPALGVLYLETNAYSPYVNITIH